MNKVLNMTSEVRTITPECALQLLTTMPYEHQRPVRERAKEIYKKDMQSGHWMPGSNIKIGRVDGKEYLLDGQHRLHAVFDSDKPQIFSVTTIEFEDMGTLAECYYRTDTGAARTLVDAYRAVGLSDKTGMAKDHQTKLGAAVRFLLSGFSANRNNVFSRDEILEAILDWTPEMLKFLEAVLGGDRQVIARLSTSPVLCLCLYTLRHSPDKAFTFWHSVAHNDGLAAGTPEHTLVKMFLSFKVNQLGPMIYMRRVAHAWNAYYAGNGITMTQVRDPTLPIIIAGTPLRRK